MTVLCAETDGMMPAVAPRGSRGAKRRQQAARCVATTPRPAFTDSVFGSPSRTSSDRPFVRPRRRPRLAKLLHRKA